MLDDVFLVLDPLKGRWRNGWALPEYDILVPACLRLFFAPIEDEV